MAEQFAAGLVQRDQRGSGRGVELVFLGELAARIVSELRAVGGELRGQRLDRRDVIGSDVNVVQPGERARSRPHARGRSV